MRSEERGGTRSLPHLGSWYATVSSEAYVFMTPEFIITNVCMIDYCKVIVTGLLAEDRLQRVFNALQEMKRLTSPSRQD